MTTPTQDPAAPVAVNAHTIVLDEPIKRGEQTIDRITLRKPKAGELRGISLSDLLNLDAAAIIKVVTRISMPVLTEAEARSMDPADLVEVGGTIGGFLLKKSMKELLSPDM
ncbi:phage tail assembly protein [Pseudomonas sp.]|uniref:phage tail assembly protein n=1 Tax=Pseudomonas sp. TaxID=306 RepID=UPI0028A2512D|nr:phage tail assembly protein [Pseudomonas sp.]